MSLQLSWPVSRESVVSTFTRTRKIVPQHEQQDANIEEEAVSSRTITLLLDCFFLLHIS